MGAVEFFRESIHEHGSQRFEGFNHYGLDQRRFVVEQIDQHGEDRTLHVSICLVQGAGEEPHTNRSPRRVGLFAQDIQQVRHRGHVALFHAGQQTRPLACGRFIRSLYHSCTGDTITA